MVESIGREKMDQILSAETAIFEARDRGDYAKAEELLLGMWDQIPEPKDRWDVTGVVLRDMISFYTRIAATEEALKWLSRWELHMADGFAVTRDFLAGKTLFDLGMHDAAYQRLLAAYRDSKTRPFQGKDPKYLAFLRTRMAAEGIKG